jgi:predicted DNA-binding helix-hairpin-helix protein
MVLMSPREQRAFQNEELFREVNLHIAELQEGSHSLLDEGLMPLVCECAHTGCTVPIEVDPATFEQVRENPLRFFVAPTHEELDVESIVERRKGYLIVEKHST